MKFSLESAELYIPDGVEESTALSRTTHLCVAAHQDDIEIMAYDGVFLEVLKNLEYLEKDTFFMSYSPLPIVGADSCPVRAYAIEGLPGFGD